MYIIMMIKIILIVVFLNLTFSLYASEKSSSIKILEETLNLFENNENNSNSEKIEKNLIDLKELIQINLKMGNPEAPIDIYLFLNGIIRDDIYSLQSLLSQNENSELPNYISKNINLSVAKKLAVGLKENRSAVKTKIIIERPLDKKDCEIFINGTLSKNLNTFYSPAGVPIYLGIYCQNETFEIQKVQPGESQEVQKVYFNHFQVKQKMPVSIPNPLKSKGGIETSPVLSSKAIVDSESPISVDNDFQFTTGVGYLRGFGVLSNDCVKNANLANGSFLYSTSSFSYKTFLLTFDYAPIYLNEKIQLSFKDPYSSKETKKEEYVKGSGYFIRTGLGVHLQIFKLTKNLELDTDLLSNFVYLNGEYQGSNKTGYGLQSWIGPTLKFDSGILIDLRFGIGYTFGKLNGLQMDCKWIANGLQMDCKWIQN